jgi:hypothetical protein
VRLLPSVTGTRVTTNRTPFVIIFDLLVQQYRKWGVSYGEMRPNHRVLLAMSLAAASR